MIIFFLALGLALKACAIRARDNYSQTKLKLNFIVFSASAILFLCGIVSFISDNYYQNAQYYDQDGNRSEAVANLKQARQINPINPQYSSQLAHFHLAANQLAAAQQEISNAIAWADNSQNFLLQGRIFLAQNRPDLAQSSFQKSIEKYPYNLGAYAQMANLYKNQNRFSEIPPLLAKILPAYKKEYIFSPLYISADKKSILNQISDLHAINADAYAKLGQDDESKTESQAAAEYAQ
jgi:tetratricopeptide (TPR) repeat protein